MSLVVAVIEPEFLIITGDTRLVRDGEPISTLFTGSLKVVIISERLCLAYTGDQIHGENVIKMASKLENLEEVIELLRSGSQIEDDGESLASFIIASSNPENRCIIRVVEGEITTIREGETWIGNGDAYRLFQKFQNTLSFRTASPGIPEYIHKKSQFIQAMEKVIHDESVTNVGDIDISASDDGKGFIYTYKFSSMVGNLTLLPGTNIIPFSTGPGTDSMLSEVLIPQDIGVGAVCVYIHEARLGAIYAPTMLHKSPEKVEAVNVAEFISKVKSITNVQLMGSGFSS